MEQEQPEQRNEQQERNQKEQQERESRRRTRKSKMLKVAQCILHCIIKYLFFTLYVRHLGPWTTSTNLASMQVAWWDTLSAALRTLAAAFVRLFNAGECSCSMALVYVFEPVCLKSAHDAINFSSGLHRKYCTEIVNLLYSEGYTGPPSASCSFLFSSCSLSPAAPSDFSLAARSSALAVLAPYLHANEMFNYYVIKIGSCKYTWYKQHH